MERLHIFDEIEIGMPVKQESDKSDVGTVEFMKYGKATTPGVDIVTEFVRDVFDAKPDFPDEVYEKLYAEGFIRVERGLKPDAFVFPSQIAHIANNEVHIKVDEDDLLTE